MLIRPYPENAEQDSKMTFTQPEEDVSNGAAVLEERLGEEFQKSVNLTDQCGSEALDSGSQVSTCECEGEPQYGIAGCDPDGVEASAHKVAYTGTVDPLSMTTETLPPGIRRCVELQQVTISEDPKCAKVTFSHDFSINEYSSVVFEQGPALQRFLERFRNRIPLAAR